MGAQGRNRRSAHERRGLRAESERPGDLEYRVRARDLTNFRRQLLEESVDGVCGELCTVEGRRWKPSERLRDCFGSDGPCLGRCTAAEFLGQDGGAGDGGSAAAA